MSRLRVSRVGQGVITDGGAARVRGQRVLGHDRYKEGVRSSQGLGVGQGRPRDMPPPG